MTTILDNDFVDRNDGLTTPIRNELVGLDAQYTGSTGRSHRLQVAPFGIEIISLSRSDPPGYSKDGVARASGFMQSNLFHITSEPRMPPISVECRTFGFDPRESRILWRVILRHVLCRHRHVGSSRYQSGCLILEDEWQGEAISRSFTLFSASPSPAVSCTYNRFDARPMGGNGFLQVAAVVPGATAYAEDFVHLRMAGTNPSRAEVAMYIDALLGTRDINLKRMVANIFEHESGTTQFKTSSQTGTSYRGVRFDWPDDPPDYPLASFDCGVGISQYTWVERQTITPGVAWDWQCNITKAINLFLRDKVFASLAAVRNQRSTFSWQDVAWGAYRRYNGSGDRAIAYANRLSNTPRGLQVDRTANLTAAAANAHLGPVSEPEREPGPPPPWPPPLRR